MIRQNSEVNKINGEMYMSINSIQKEDDIENCSFKKGIILKGVGGEYKVLLDDDVQVIAKPRGSIRQDKYIPYPGDHVLLNPGDTDTDLFSIEKILPRKSFILRPAVANIDSLIITCSAKNPKTDMFFIDKMIIISIKEGIDPVICITKSDLDSKRSLELKKEYNEIGFPVFLLGEGNLFYEDYKLLDKYIEGKIVSFAGQSGVGKSTLLNKLVQKDCMKTGEISERNKSGKHTTRHSEIFPYKKSLIADTPGFTTIELKDLDVRGEDVLAGYPELDKYEGSYKFADCRHLGEKGCSVKHDEYNSGRISRYQQFRREIDLIMPHEYKNKK